MPLHSFHGRRRRCAKRSYKTRCCRPGPNSLNPSTSPDSDEEIDVNSGSTSNERTGSDDRDAEQVFVGENEGSGDEGWF